MPLIERNGVPFSISLLTQAYLIINQDILIQGLAKSKALCQQLIFKDSGKGNENELKCTKGFKIHPKFVHGTSQRVHNTLRTEI